MHTVVSVIWLSCVQEHFRDSCTKFAPIAVLQIKHEAECQELQSMNVGCVCACTCVSMKNNLQQSAVIFDTMQDTFKGHDSFNTDPIWACTYAINKMRYNLLPNSNYRPENSLHHSYVRHKVNSAHNMERIFIVLTQQ